MWPWIPFILPTNRDKASDSGTGGASSSESSEEETENSTKHDVLMQILSFHQQSEKRNSCTNAERDISHNPLS